jgi:hypothetical protein
MLLKKVPDFRVHTTCSRGIHKTAVSYTEGNEEFDVVAVCTVAESERIQNDPFPIKTCFRWR